MSALEQMDLVGVRTLATADASDRAIRWAVAGSFWRWFRANADQPARIAVRVLLRALLRRGKLRIRDLIEVFELVVGPDYTEAEPPPPPAAGAS